jgi:outer membrane protein assembly factor BamA
MRVNEKLDNYANSSLDHVKLSFSKMHTDSRLLRKLLRDLRKSPNIDSLHKNIIQAAKTLAKLDTFKLCNVKVKPGNLENTANVKFKLTEMQTWYLRGGINSDNRGKRASLSLHMRNLRQKCDGTVLTLAYLYNTKSIGFEFQHYDRLLIPGKFEGMVKVRKWNEFLDHNFLEDLYGGSVILMTPGKVHTLYTGIYTRTPIISVQNASRALLSELSVNNIRHLGYIYRKDKTDHPTKPTSGLLFSIKNEIACGDSQYHKLETSLSRYFVLKPSTIFQASAAFSAIMPWSFTSTYFSDRYRLNDLKGFISLGAREPAIKPEFQENVISGDNIGRDSYLLLEGKIHFYDVPVLKKFGLIPFVYGNLVVPDPLRIRNLQGYVRDNYRAATGVGIGYNFTQGRVELSYTAQAIKRAEDYVAEIQFLMTEG